MTPEFRMYLATLEKVPYEFTGTNALYDRETDTYYNEFGQELIHPSEYDYNSEGYTPFGDE